MAASNRKKAEMYILFSCNAWHEYSSFEPKAVFSSLEKAADFLQRTEETETGGRCRRMFHDDARQSDSGQEYQLPGTVLSLQSSPRKRLGMTKNPFINNHIKIYDYDK